MSVMRTGNFAKLRTPQYRKVFFDKFSQRPAEYTHVFKENDSKRSYEEDFPVSTLSPAVVKPEGEAITYATAIEGSSVRYTHLSYALGFLVTREMQADDLYSIFPTRMTNALARSLNHAVETVAWSILNNGFSSSYTGFDSLALFHTAHTLLGGGTAANRPSTDIDISLAGVEAAVQTFESWVDESGSIKINIKPSLLVVDPTYKWVAREILGSSFKPYTSDNEINPLMDEDLKYFVSHYLASAGPWFMLAKPEDHDLNFFWREKPVFDGMDDKKTKASYFDVFARFSAGFGDWRGAYGSNGP